MLSISNLAVSVDTKHILNAFTLSCELGSTHALMGPNGSGKSTLAYTLMGHPRYEIHQGSMNFLGMNLNDVSVDKRAQLGIFLSFQHPISIPGVTVATFLKEAYQSLYGLISVKEFQELLFSYMDLLQIDHSFSQRNLNEDFSGGEKKRMEMLQMLVLKSKLLILDEVDSGLDVDALVLVARAVHEAKKQNPEMICLIITHYPRILQYLVPDYVHVVMQGTVRHSGSAELAQTIEQKGYDGFIAD